MASQLNVDVIVAETTTDVQINDSLDVTGAVDLDSTLNVAGATTLNGAVTLGNAAGDAVTVTGTVASNLIFTDATYDIGASAATRPRDLHLSRNAVVGTGIELGHATDTTLTRSAAGVVAVEGLDLIGSKLIDAKGDLIVGTAADTAAILSVGSAGTVPMSRAAATSGIAYVAAITKAIYGLVQSNDSGDTTNDVGITAGGAMDATGAYWMTLASAIVKRIDASWVVGTAQGGLDGTEGVAGTPDVSTWYYIWLIARSDTGVVDALFSESATAPTMPASYDFKRLIGAVFNNAAGNIDQFTAYETEGGGLEIQYTTISLDVDLAATLTTNRRTDAVRVPLAFSVKALLRVSVDEAAATSCWIICNPDEADAAPSISAVPLATARCDVAGAYVNSEMTVRTSAAGLVASRANVATVDDYQIATLGFHWARRN